MLNPNDLAREVPQAPNEINIFQAAGLIPHFVAHKTPKALQERLRIHDPVVRVWALGQLLKNAQGMSNEVLQMAMHVARRSAWLRQRLLPVLIRGFRFDLVEKLRTLEQEQAEQNAQLHVQMLQATVKNDYSAQVRLYEQLYLLTGDVQHITEAKEVARQRLGWKEAWKPYLRVILTHSELATNALTACLRMLEREDAREPFAILASIIRPMKEETLPNTYAQAQLLFWDKKYAECLDVLKRSNALKSTENKHSLFTNLAARAAERMGDYSASAGFYQTQNNTLRMERLKPERFIQELETRSRWPIGNLSPDTHDNYFIMTGFPRSGTTLLENVLASHPKVATCEETSSLIGSLMTAYQAPIAQDLERKNLNLRAAYHRQLYYENLNRYVGKKDARVVIDKTPIIGANIKYMEKIFPNKRYVFSIRHPYDVVLSNYKQDYQQNIAMSAFNNMQDACVLYDYVMRNWFDVFPGETDRVCYVKYDDLVSDFDHVINSVLSFLGLEWTDEVRNFAEHASNRPVRTPSYANVRKGLSIGVQSSWQQFEFLFDDSCRLLLDPWVKRFGY